MSKISLRYNINQRKYNLKFIFYIFVLLDLMLFFNISFAIFMQLLAWELFTFLGLMIGVRGQTRYRELVYELIAIRNDPRYNDKEDLRGFKLARHIDHACIEWDLWFQEQQKKSTKKKNDQGKINHPGNNKIKNVEVKIMSEETKRTLILWDTTVWKQFGYLIIGLWGVASPIIAVYLSELGFHWAVVLFLVGAWVFIDIFIAFYLHYIFQLEPVEVNLNVYSNST